MMSFRSLMVVLLVSGVAQAQGVATAIVPVAGSVFGASMVRWKTDIEVYNAGRLPTDVVLELTAFPGAFLSTTLAPGQRELYRDIVGLAFGQENALSPLRVASDHPVTVRAYCYPADGLSAPQSIDVYYHAAYFPDRVLDGLAFSDAYRTNIGLANLGDRDAQFVLALQRIPGRDLAVTTLTIPAGGIAHASIQSLFPLITAGTGFSVVVEAASQDTYVYGSVIESATNSARFITPRIGTR
jgi:hypothetical protein